MTVCNESCFIGNTQPNNMVTVVSQLGTITADILYQYFTNYFFSWIRNIKILLPIIVFIDCSLPISLLLSEFCSSNGIILISLPPNTTELLKPMNNEILDIFRVKWEEERKKWMSERDFLPLLKVVVDKVKGNSSLFEKSFRTCGNVYGLPLILAF